MIIIKSLQHATTLVSEALTEEEQKSIASDIQNWLFAEKSIYCEVE